MLYRQARVLVTAAGFAVAIAACGGTGNTASLQSAPNYNPAPQNQAPQAAPGTGTAPQAQVPANGSNGAALGAAGGSAALPGTAPGRGAAAGAVPVPVSSQSGVKGNLPPVPGAVVPGASQNGCGGGPKFMDTWCGGPTQGNTASDVGITPTTVTFGLINFRSATRSLGPVITDSTSRLLAAEFQYTNDHGGVAGRQMRMLTCDDGGDVTRARACYEKLKGQVFAFLPGESFLSDTIHQELDKDKIPWLSWAWFTSEWQDPYMFPCHGNGLRETSNMAEWLSINKHPKTVGILYLNDAEDIAGKNSAVHILEGHGIKIVSTIGQEWDSADESQHVLAMRVANPDAILAPTWPTPLAKFFHEAEQEHYAPPMGFFSKHLILDSGYGGIWGDYVKDRFYSINSWIEPGSPGNTDAEENLPGLRFIEFLTAKYTGYDNNGFKTKYFLGHHITQAGAVCAAIAMNLLKEMGPNPTRQGLIDRLESRSFESYMGQTMRWPKGNHDLEPYAFHNEYVYLWASPRTSGPVGWKPDPTGFDTVRVQPNAITPVITCGACTS